MITYMDQGMIVFLKSLKPVVAKELNSKNFKKIFFNSSRGVRASSTERPKSRSLWQKLTKIEACHVTYW